MTVRIPLTGGYGGFALVDDEDAERILQFGWWARPYKHGREDAFYAYRHYRLGPPHLMHRFILEPAKHEIIDHIDFNGLNNTRANLRVCTRSSNNIHRRIKLPNQYRGIGFDARYGKWVARVQKDGRCYRAGQFDDPVAAARAYDDLARQHHGEFAILNFPGEAA